MVKLIFAIFLAALLLPLSCSTTQEEGVDGQEIQAEDVEQGTQNTQIDPYDDNWNDVGSQNTNVNQQTQNTQATNTQNTATEETYNENTFDNQVPEYEQPVVQQSSPFQQTFPEQTTPQQTYPPFQQTTPFDVTQQTTEPPPPPPPAPPPPAPVPDLLPVTAELWWVGFDYQPRDSIVRIEMLTRGSPDFDFIKEMNQAEQPELVVRFYQTSLRQKVRRDMDASEFLSPVAFIRMREKVEDSSVDVVLTLRDPVKPRMFAEDGNVLLTFAIPDRYFGNSLVGQPPIGEAILLAQADIAPEFDDGSQLPLAAATVPDPAGEVFDEVTPEATVPVNATETTELEQTELEATNTQPIDTESTVGTIPTGNYTGNTTGGQTTNLFEETDLPDSFDNTATGGGYDDTATGGYDNGYGGAGTTYDQGTAVGNANYEFESQTGAQYQYENETTGYDYNETGGEATGTGNYQYEDTGGEYEDTGDEYDGFEEDDLEDFDDGDGEATQEVDLFDVRYTPKGFLRLTVGAVAQDNYEYDYNNTGANYQYEDTGTATQGTATQTTGTQTGYDDDYDDTTGNTGNTADYDATGNIGNGNYGNATLTGNADPAATGNYGTEATATGTQATGTNLLGTQATDTNLIGDVAPESTGGNYGATNTYGEATGATNTYESTGANPFSVDGGGGNYSEPPIDGAVDLAAEDTYGSDTEYVDAQPVGRPIKIDFRGAPLAEVIRVLSEESGINFVFPEALGEKRVYLSLNNIPFSQALEALLQSQGLGKVQIASNLIRIDELTKLEEEQKTRAQTQRNQKVLTPTKVLVMRMSYAQAEAVAPIVTEFLKESAETDKRVKVQADERTNSLVVEAVPTDLAKVKTLVERLDLQTPQVKIASRIMEVTKTFGRFIGLSWASPLDFNQGRGLGFGNLVFPNSLTSQFAIDPNLRDTVGSFDFRFGSINNAINLDLRLRLEQTAGTTEILQTNNVVVEDNQEAQVTAGTTDFFVVQSEDETDLEAVNYNLNLFVTPHITSDGAVQMNVRILSNEAAPTFSDDAVTATSNKEVRTSLLKQSGETAVIGGAFDSTRQLQKNGVPFLSDIPIIGALFRSTNRADRQRELLILVTPTILNAAQSFAGPSVATNIGGNYGGGNYGGGYDNTGTNGYNNTGTEYTDGLQGTNEYTNGGTQGQYTDQNTGGQYEETGAFNYQGQGTDTGTQGTGNYQNTGGGYENNTGYNNTGGGYDTQGAGTQTTGGFNTQTGTQGNGGYDNTGTNTGTNTGGYNNTGGYDNTATQATGTYE